MKKLNRSQRQLSFVGSFLIVWELVAIVLTNNSGSLASLRITEFLNLSLLLGMNTTVISSFFLFLVLAIIPSFKR